jgi:hypothetical protein
MNLCAHPSTYPWDSSEALGHGYCHEGVPGQVSRMITFFFKSGRVLSLRKTPCFR